jgi:hypothetical protein
VRVLLQAAGKGKVRVLLQAAGKGKVRVLLQAAGKEGAESRRGPGPRRWRRGIGFAPES